MFFITITNYRHFETPVTVSCNISCSHHSNWTKSILSKFEIRHLFCFVLELKLVTHDCFSFQLDTYVRVQDRTYINSNSTIVEPQCPCFFCPSSTSTSPLGSPTPVSIVIWNCSAEVIHQLRAFMSSRGRWCFNLWALIWKRAFVYSNTCTGHTHTIYMPP